MESKNGCAALDINEIWQFMDRYRFIFGGVFIAIGLFINFFGYVSIKPTVFIVSSCTVTLALLITIYMLIVGVDAISDVWNWIILVVCVLLGLAAGFLLTKAIRFGVGVMGGATGFAIGLLCGSLFEIGNQWVFWSVCAVLALAFFGLTFHKSNEAIMLLTALIGSYVWVRGVSVMIPDSYINEFTLVSQLANGYEVSVPWSFWLYLALIIVSIIGGFYV
jgi:hypothetical protein